MPSLVMEGAIKPMMISGTQKLMNWLLMNLTVTRTFSRAAVTGEPSAALRARPAQMPTASATKSLKGRLLKKLSFFISFFISPLIFYSELPVFFTGRIPRPPCRS